MRILRGLTSRLLPCGCLAGVYETYDGPVVTLLDEKLTACADPRHMEGKEVPTTAIDNRLTEPTGRSPSTGQR